MKYLLPFYANVDQIDSPFQITKFIYEVEQGDCDASFIACKASLPILPMSWPVIWSCIIRMYYSLSSS